MWLVEGREIFGLVVIVLALAHGTLTLIALLLWRETSSSQKGLPAVTVLKPLYGKDVFMEEALRGFCQQAYPDYQIVYGVRDPQDPALEVVERLRLEFPHLPMTVVVEPTIHGANYKVSNLINMLPAAKHDYLVLADSDIHVGKHYLSTIIPPLLNSSVGVVTCCYRGRPKDNLWSRLSALYINDWFMPSVLLAHMLGGHKFAFGATIAMRRQTLQDIGGFRAIVNQLADDCALSLLSNRKGLKTVLSSYVVETTTSEQDFKALFHHELRWLRTNRFLEPLGYAFSFLTFTLPLSILGLCLSDGKALAWALAMIAVSTRLLLHVEQQRRSQRHSLVALWLIPLRDVMTSLMWAVSFFSHKVNWGRHQFEVHQDGSFEEEPSRER